MAATGLVKRFLSGAGSLFGLGVINRERVYGPRVTATKNIGKSRPWIARSCYSPHASTRERLRRKRQIDAGQLQITGETDAMRSLRLAMAAIERTKEVA